MGWFDDNSDQAQAYSQVKERPHEASWSHELLAGAAAYEVRLSCCFTYKVSNLLNLNRLRKLTNSTAILTESRNRMKKPKKFCTSWFCTYR